MIAGTDSLTCPPKHESSDSYNLIRPNSERHEQWDLNSNCSACLSVSLTAKTIAHTLYVFIRKVLSFIEKCDCENAQFNSTIQ